MGSFRYVLSRRHVLQASVSAALVSMLRVDVAAASLLDRNDRRSYVSRVTNVAGRQLEAEALLTHERFTVPIAGFPPQVIPRIGDLVTVTNSHPSFSMANLPVCSWYVGPVMSRSDGRAEIAGLLAAGPLRPKVLNDGHQAVCLLDTTLSDRQVLGVRVAA